MSIAGSLRECARLWNVMILPLDVFPLYAYICVVRQNSRKMTDRDGI